MNKRVKFGRWPLIATALLMSAGVTLGEDNEGSASSGHDSVNTPSSNGSDASLNDTDGYDAVLKSVQDGSILPLYKIRDIITKRLGGDIVGVHIHAEDGKTIYELKILKDDGRLVEADVNAADGEILEIENE